MRWGSDVGSGLNECVFANYIVIVNYHSQLSHMHEVPEELALDSDKVPFSCNDGAFPFSDCPFGVNRTPEKLIMDDLVFSV